MHRFLPPNLIRKYLPVLLFLAFAGCVTQTLPAPTSTASPSPSISATLPAQTPSLTATRTPTASFTALPSATRTATALTSLTSPTATHTLAYVYQRPTVTRMPTFDINHNPTLTPAAPAVCPTVASGPAPAFEPPPTSDPVTGEVFIGVRVIDNILPYANTYGLWQLYTEINRLASLGQCSGESLAYRDLTNDGVPELMFNTLGMEFSGKLFALGCQEGEIRVLYEQYGGGLGAPKVRSIVDGNRNGIPELLLITNWDNRGGRDFQVYEWDGDRFSNRLFPSIPDYPDSGYIYVGVFGKVFFTDLDGDGFQELVSNTGNHPVFPSEIPSRNVNCIYEWNGEYYVAVQKQYSPPEYRFQAAQDGDLFTLLGEYNRALEMYRQVIYSETLGGWSPELREYLVDSFFEYGISDVPAPPVPDPLEYPNLAAYAHYRIVLLYVLQGWDTDARAIYQSLQARYPEGQPGHAYAELAFSFWNEYQSSGDLNLSCDRAVDYAAAHQSEILDYLGSDNWGDYSREYQPSDICLNWGAAEVYLDNCRN